MVFYSPSFSLSFISEGFRRISFERIDHRKGTYHMNIWLETTFYQNSVREYLIALGIIIASFVFIKIFTTIIIRRLKKLSEKTETTLDDFVVEQIERIGRPVLYGTAVFLSLQYLILSDTIAIALQWAISILVTFIVARFIIALLNYFIRNYWGKQEGDRGEVTIRGISGFISFLVWGLSIVFLLDNFGFKISTIVTGLGIGGIAVALAAQTILGDLFSYFVIFFDRPFQIGDFIIVDDKVGAIEHIGIKSTRIRSLSGEELVISNKNLTDSRIHNFKKMERRRVLFTIGVTYQTPYEQIKEISTLLKSIVEEQKFATFDRSHFKAYGDFSLNFEVVYYVDGPDYVRYMDIQQNINLRIHEEFSKRKIEFAYPTQVVYTQPLR